MRFPALGHSVGRLYPWVAKNIGMLIIVWIGIVGIQGLRESRSSYRLTGRQYVAMLGMWGLRLLYEGDDDLSNCGG